MAGQGGCTSGGWDSGAGTGHSVENIPNDNLVLSQPVWSLAKFDL